MKTRPTPPLTAAQREALEARFALRLSARLEEGAQAVPHDVAERLRVAREQAVRAAREARAAVAVVPQAAPVAVGVPGLSGAGSAGGVDVGLNAGLNMAGGWSASPQARTPGRKFEDGPTSWGWRLAAVLPLVALVAGLWGIQRYAKHEQVEAATDVDMQLLTDDLPPDAYADPGFEEFLSRDTGPAVRAIEDAPPEADGDLSTTETQSDLAETEGAPATQTP